MSSSQMNHFFEQVLFRLKCLKQFAARAAQIYKLLNQNSLSDAWQSLWLEMSQNSGDPVMTELIKGSSSSNSHWTEETVRLGPKTDEPLIWPCVNRALEWMAKLTFLWFLIVYVERWAD